MSEIEIEILLTQPDDFLKIKETLTRMGIASKKEPKLYQSCHILHKQGRYYVVHFKTLFELDRKPTNISEEDIARRNTIANLLEQWGLLKIVHPEMYSARAPINTIKILPFKDKSSWQLIPKYNIGRPKITVD